MEKDDGDRKDDGDETDEGDGKEQEEGDGKEKGRKRATGWRRDGDGNEKEEGDEQEKGRKRATGRRQEGKGKEEGDGRRGKRPTGSRRTRATGRMTVIPELELVSLLMRTAKQSPTMSGATGDRPFGSTIQTDCRPSRVPFRGGPAP
jgi:hypothetical protein